MTATEKAGGAFGGGLVVALAETRLGRSRPNFVQSDRSTSERINRDQQLVAV